MDNPWDLDGVPGMKGKGRKGRLGLCCEVLVGVGVVIGNGKIQLSALRLMVT